MSALPLTPVATCSSAQHPKILHSLDGPAPHEVIPSRAASFASPTPPDIEPWSSLFAVPFPGLGTCPGLLLSWILSPLPRPYTLCSPSLSFAGPSPFPPFSSEPFSRGSVASGPGSSSCSLREQPPLHHRSPPAFLADVSRPGPTFSLRMLVTRLPWLPSRCTTIPLSQPGLLVPPRAPLLPQLLPLLVLTPVPDPPVRVALISPLGQFAPPLTLLPQCLGFVLPLQHPVDLSVRCGLGLRSAPAASTHSFRLLLLPCIPTHLSFPTRIPLPSLSPSPLLALHPFPHLPAPVTPFLCPPDSTPLPPRNAKRSGTLPRPPPFISSLQQTHSL